MFDTAVINPTRLSPRNVPSLLETVSFSKLSIALETLSASTSSVGCASLIAKKVTAPVRKVSSCRSARFTMTWLRLMIE